MTLRGIRGAIRVRRNTRQDIRAATRRLLLALLRANRIGTDDVASCFFTLTRDLDADFPANAARSLSGWAHVPLLCASEIAVPGALDRVLRVLLLAHTPVLPDRIRHQYLGETSCLRPDLARRNTAPRTRK